MNELTKSDLRGARARTAVLSLMLIAVQSCSSQPNVAAHAPNPAEGASATLATAPATARELADAAALGGAHAEPG